MTRPAGPVGSENLQEHTGRVRSGREVAEEVRSGSVAAGGRQMLNFSDEDVCGIDYEVDYYSAAKTFVFSPQ